MTEELRFGPAMECTHLNISKTLFLLELLAALSALVAVPGQDAHAAVHYVHLLRGNERF